MPTDFERTVYRALKPGNRKVTYEDVARALAGFTLGMRVAVRTMADDIDRVLGCAALEKPVEEVERQ